MKEDKKEMSKEEKKIMGTSFILLFPALIICILAIVFIPATLWWISLVIIALAIYHFLMLKRFVEDYYKK